MNPGLQTVVDYFEAQGWEGEVYRESRTVQANISLEDLPDLDFTTTARVNEADNAFDCFVLVFVFPPEIGSEQLQALAELCVRASLGLPSGCFTMDVAEGTVVFQVGFPYAPGGLTPDLLNRSLLPGLRWAGRYYRAFAAVFYKNVSPESVAQAVDQREEIEDSEPPPEDVYHRARGAFAATVRTTLENDAQAARAVPEEALAELQRHGKQVMDQLAEQQFARLVISFEAAHDERRVTSLKVWMQNGQTAPTLRETPFEDGTLYDAIQTLIFGRLDMQHPGWAAGVGCSGRQTINVPDRTVKLDWSDHADPDDEPAGYNQQ